MIQEELFYDIMEDIEDELEKITPTTPATESLWLQVLAEKQRLIDYLVDE